MRRKIAILSNLLIPGSGLILLRREWLGLATALLFGAAVQTVLAGTLVVPESVPGLLTAGCVGVAVTVWLTSQWQMVVRLRLVCGSALKDELVELRERAAAAAERRRFAEAIDIMRLALSLNDEDLECNLEWAKLMTAMGRFPEARRAWHRILRLDRNRSHSREAKEALSSLPER